MFFKEGFALSEAFLLKFFETSFFSKFHSVAFSILYEKSIKKYRFLFGRSSVICLLAGGFATYVC